VPSPVKKLVRSKRSNPAGHATKKTITENRSNGTGRLDGIHQTVDYASDMSALIKVTAEQLKSINEVPRPVTDELVR